MKKIAKLERRTTLTPMGQEITVYPYSDELIEKINELIDHIQALEDNSKVAR